MTQKERMKDPVYAELWEELRDPVREIPHDRASKRFAARLSENDNKTLEEIMAKTGMNQSEVVRVGLRLLAKENGIEIKPQKRGKGWGRGPGDT